MVGGVDGRCLFQPFEHGVLLGLSPLGTTPVGLLGLWRMTCSWRAWGWGTGELVGPNWMSAIPSRWDSVFSGLGFLAALTFWSCHLRPQPSWSGHTECCDIVFLVQEGDGQTSPCSRLCHHRPFFRPWVWWRITPWLFETRNSLGGHWRINDKEKTLASTRCVFVSFIRCLQAFARFATTFVSIRNIRKGFSRNSQVDC